MKLIENEVLELDKQILFSVEAMNVVIKGEAKSYIVHLVNCLDISFEENI